MPSAVPNGTIRVISDRGYKRIKDPNHPLADKSGKNKGWVSHHRWIAYNVVQGEPQRCSYCNYGPMPWRGGSFHAINIDHINEIKGDDRPDNLTFACTWCNRLKGGWPLTYHEHMRAIEKYCHHHPCDRPTPVEILAEEWMIPISDIYYNLNLNKLNRS